VSVYETGRLRIGTSFADGLCGGERGMWEAHLDELERTFGVSREPTWLYLYNDDEQTRIAEDCGYEGLLMGCWRDPVVRSIRLAVPHELVHAWLDPVQPRGLPVLSEGIATRMSGLVMSIGEEPFVPEEAGPLTLDDLVRDIPPGKYDESGHLVAWLLATYDADTFMTLYAQTRRGMTSAELSATFLDVLDRSPEDVLLTYQATARDYYPAMGGSACGRGPRIPWRDRAATWGTDSCADGSRYGFEDSDQVQRVTIEVATDGWYLLDPAGHEASVTRCLTAPADETEVLHRYLGWAVKGDWERRVPLIDLYNPRLAQYNDEWAEHELELTAGIYDVWVRRRAGEPPDEASGVKLIELDL